MGGVTGVFEMPNTKPLTVTAAALADKVRRATNRMYCDFAFYMGGTRDNVDELAAFEKLPGCAGIKVFMGSSTGDLLVEDDEGVARILAQINRRAAFHSEDEFRLRQRLSEQIAGDAASHPVWRDAEAARLCTERLLRIARRTGKRIHVLHVSTADEMPLLAANKDVATVEVTPHHLTLSSDDYARLGTMLQMNPPVRRRTISAPSGRPCNPAWSIFSAPITRRIRWKKKPSPIPLRPPACPACKRWFPSCSIM